MLMVLAVSLPLLGLAAAAAQASHTPVNGMISFGKTTQHSATRACGWPTPTARGSLAFGQGEPDLDQVHPGGMGGVKCTWIRGFASSQA
jgi:hypothetical protein